MEERAVKRVWWKRYESWTVVVVLLLLLSCGIWLAAVRRDMLAFSATLQAREIRHALMAYASAHQGQLPSGPEWRQTLLQHTPGYADMLKSPMAVRLREESYCMVDGWTEALLDTHNINRDEHILIFENPASTDADELAIAMWSGVRRRLPREEVLRRLAAMRTGDGKPVTWEGMK